MATLTRDDVNVLNYDVPRFNGTAWHIEVSGEHYIVSAIHGAFDTGRPETLIFRANEFGEPASWADLVNYPDFDHEGAIEELLEVL